MSVIDDIKTAVSGYPAASVVLSIVDVVVQAPGTAGAINVSENCAFQVRIANNGHLNMTGVALHIEGQNGATVSTALAGPYSSAIFPPAIAAVNAHSTQDTVNYYFKAPNVAKPAGTALVRVHVSTFDVNWDYIMISQTGHADPPAGTYSAQVFP